MSTKSNSVIPERVRRNWPELDLDKKAWHLAVVALGKEAPAQELARKAQKIKDCLWIWTRQGRDWSL